ncbi:MAG: hypothetical protein ACKOJH_05545 [Actinomycetota bacterium]
MPSGKPSNNLRDGLRPIVTTITSESNTMLVTTECITRQPVGQSMMSGNTAPTASSR